MADENVKHHMPLSELIKKHQYHRDHNIKHEFLDLLITGDNEEIEADLSGIRIRNSTFSGVNFTKIKLPKGRLSNVRFVEADHLTLTICKGPKPSPNSEREPSAVVVQEQEERISQRQLPGWPTDSMPAPSPSATVSAEEVSPDLLLILQDIRNMKAKEIIKLIRKSLIRETVDKVTNRPEQAQFRRDLLKGYDHQCAISGPARDDLLEAAHIIPYFLLEKVGAGQFGNSRWNGLALRPGLHRLFDEDKLRITDQGIIFVDAQVPGFYVNWEQVVQPPIADNPSVSHEHVWRDFLRWRFQEYRKYVRYLGNQE